MLQARIFERPRKRVYKYESSRSTHRLLMAKSTPSKPTSKKSKPAPLKGNKPWRERQRVRISGPSQRDKTAWEKLPVWGQHAVCIGFLFVVAVGFTAPTTFGGLTLAGSDIVQWRGMAEAMLTYETSSNGQEALWAPNAFGGMPGYMIHYPSQILGLDSILLGLRALGLWPVAHFFVLLCGMYLLVAFLTRSRLAGVGAAVAYGLTTYLPILLVAGHNTKFVTLVFAPWLLLAVAAILYRPDESKWYSNLLMALLFAIAAAISLRAKHPQITYYLVFAVGVWWMAEGVAALRLKRWKQFGTSTALLLLGSILALLVVAHPYLPQWEYKAYTIRSSGAGGGLVWDYAMAWSQGIKESITVVIAAAFGGSGQTYWGPKTFTSGPHYFGALTVMLSVLGIFGVARRATTGLGLAALLMTLFALGENFPLVNRPMFAFFPMFSSFRVPETWLAAVALIVALLAGYGLYYLLRREATEEGEQRKSRWLYGSFSIALVFLALLYAGSGTVFEFTRDGEVEQIEAAAAAQLGTGVSDPRVRNVAGEFLRNVRVERKAMFKKDALRSILVIALALGFLVLYRRRTIPPWALAAGFILLITTDLWGVGRRYFNEDSPAMRARSDVASAIQGYDFDLFIQNEVETAGGPGNFRTLPLALNAMSDGRSPYFYESTGGYHAAKLALYQDYIDHLLTADGDGLNLNALDLMSTRYVISQTPIAGLEPVYQSQETGLLVLEKEDVLPRAFFVDDIEVIADEEQVFSRLRDSTLDLSRIAILPEALEDFSPAPFDSTNRGIVNLQRYGPREIVWEVETDRPRLMVVSEVYYSAGWTATIDDRETPILRANHLLRAVQVPAGNPIVAMTFEPRSHTTGLLISFLATLLVYLGAAVLGGLSWYRKGHPA